MRIEHQRRDNVTMLQNNGVYPVGELACQHVLSRFAPRVIPVRVEPLVSRGGFSGAAIWRVVTQQGDFALRCWPAPGLPRARILGLHRLLTDLRETGLSFISVPVLANDGKSLVADWNHDWQLEPWMPGTADFHDNPSEARLRSAMAAMAQWHLAASRFVPAEDAAPWFHSTGEAESPTVMDRLKILQTATGEMHRVDQRIALVQNQSLRELTTRVLQLFRLGRANAMRELELVRGVRVRLQPCLRDVWHDHVLFESDRVTGLIDPSACRTESVACDLSRLIGSLVGDDSTKWEVAIEEYHRWRPLTSDERALTTVFDRTGVLLSGWTWLNWICLERRSFPDPDAVEKRLKEILDRMKQLVK